MVALAVEVKNFVPWFHEGIEASVGKVQGYVKEIYNFLFTSIVMLSC